jgi:hypothetical protein
MGRTSHQFAVATTAAVLLLRFGYGFLGSLETDAGMGAIAKRLISRTAAAAEGKCWFAGEVVGIAVCIYQFDCALGCFDPQRPIARGP